MIIREKYLNQLIETKDLNLIKVITGVRRSGKSTLLLQFKDYLTNSGIDKNNIIRLKRFLKRKINEYVEPKLLYNDVFFIGLTTPRANLYDIINKRVDKMFLDGLVDEVKTLYQKYPESSILKRAIGYKEIIAFLNGEISLEEAKELIKKN